MDKFFNKVPEIIREAAKSTLGVISLIIITLSLLALTFFTTASENVRVGIFILIFIGASIFIANSLRYTSLGKSEVVPATPKAENNEKETDINTIQDYLARIVEKYNALESIYTSLPLSIAPRIPDKFSPTFLDNRSFQVLVERNMGPEYHTTERIRFSSIQKVVKKYSHIILLGNPGCGKTVTIWKLAIDYAKRALANYEFRSIIPVLISLGQYDGSIKFYDWLLLFEKKIPDFPKRLKAGSLLFLLDGLNEMPKATLSGCIKELHQFIEDHNNSKYVVTCRRHDYDKFLELQQVEIEPLDKNFIKSFILNYFKDNNKTQNLYAILMSDVRLAELASNAFNLKLIVALYDQLGDEFPRNRSKLLYGFIGALYTREKINRSSEIFSEEELLKVLGRLAFTIHDEISKGTSVKKDWAIKRIISSFPTLPLEDILDFAKNMGVLEKDQLKVRFQHQLMQEYFAATELENLVLLGLDENAKNKYWGKTGWEQVTIMLSGIQDDASELVKNITDLNPVLAARCISEGLAQTNDKTQEKVINSLIDMIGNPAISLQDRINAGTAIGEFDDPRFQKLPTPKKFVIVPPLAKIPLRKQVTDKKRKHIIGRNKEHVSKSYSDETPKHIVELGNYRIGKYQITNVEYEGFIRDHGYDKKQYWSNEGWAWRQGEIKDEIKKWLIDGYKSVRIQVLQEVERLEPSREKDKDSEEMDIWWKILMEWADDRAELELEKLFVERNCHPHFEPYYWNDPFFNGKTQPVITTWFEAQAYCVWLSEITNQRYRLPTEAEWEASTGGSTKQYPWGKESDPSKHNILPTHAWHRTALFTTTPVGIFSDGVSKYGIYDLLGNVWEWTSSAKFQYPYDGNDGREKQFLPDCRRIVRGGSWAVSPSSARNSCRGNFPPDNMVRNYIGFRVVCDE
jgi:formylglycine-generating enzyme required for sulfatase activity